jgi:hypothetical protein
MTYRVQRITKMTNFHYPLQPCKLFDSVSKLSSYSSETMDVNNFLLLNNTNMASFSSLPLLRAADWEEEVSAARAGGTRSLRSRKAVQAV